jgi:hypothetical protein
MATKQLLQILLKSRDGIKSGATKVADIVTEYLTTTGAKTISPEERFTINKEFSELAPSNVVDDIFGDFKGVQDDAGEVVSDTLFTDKVSDQLGMKLRGDETFGELMKIKRAQEAKKGIGSMIPKEYYGYNRGPSGEIQKIPNPINMDDIIASERAVDKSRIKNFSQRDDYAQFIRKMRGKDFTNPDIKKIVTESGGNIAEGKQAATTLARAAEMGADTKIKQEILSDLDVDKLERGPGWWKGDDRYPLTGGPMGEDSFGEMSDVLIRKINGGVMDDLDIVIGEDKTNEFFRFIEPNNFKNDPEAFVQAVKSELESSAIKYDMTFWENYVDEIMQLIKSEPPMFRTGGLV